MLKHFIHYLPRRIVMQFPDCPDDPWFALDQRAGDGFGGPVSHVTRRRSGPTLAIKPGDVIWLVSQIHSPWGVLPPGLDARLDVASVEVDADGRREFHAAPTSTWFPLADMRGVLKVLKTGNGTGAPVELWKSPDRPIGHSLQSIRQLADATPMLDWAEKLTATTPDFISYRICDGTKKAYKKVSDLLENDVAVFWDRWCLPRRLAERREVVDDARLDEHLMKLLRASANVWGIESPLYGAEKSYSLKEQTEAIRLEIFRPDSD